MKCEKCGNENQNNAKFCEKCGHKLVEITKFCSNCGAKIANDSIFCSNCGHKKGDNVKLKLNFKNLKIPKLDLSSKIISLSFLICAILSVVLLSKNGFYRWLFGSQILNSTFVACISIVVGLIIFFINYKPLNFKDMLTSLKKLSFNKNLVACIFILSGIIMLIFSTNTRFIVNDFSVLICMILLISFLVLCSTIIIYNWSTLKKAFLIFACLLIFIGFLVLGGSKRIAKNVANTLESQGYSCKSEDELYTCTKINNNQIEEWEINYYNLSPEHPSITYTVKEDDYYSFEISKTTYHHHGSVYYYNEDNHICYYYPTYIADKGLEEIADYNYNEIGMEPGTIVSLWRSDYKNNCPNKDNLINESLRKYENLHETIGLDLK